MAYFQRLIFLCCTLALLITRASGAPPTSQTQMVFAPFNGANNRPEMQIANADGSNIRSVLPVTRNPHVLSLAVDHRDQSIYYGGWAPDYEISRVKIDGSGKTTLYNMTALDPLVFNRPNATPTPYGISLDIVHNKVYWVGGQHNSNGFGSDISTFIQRANLDGSNVEIVRQTLWSVSSPYGLVVDGASEKMYWTDQANFSIRSANLDGSGMQTIFQRGRGKPVFPWLMGGLAIDFDHQIMFWSELTSDYENTNIHSANLDGSGVRTLLTVETTGTNWFDMPLVIGLAVDPTTRQLYFADASDTTPGSEPSGSIHRINYDGTNLQTLIAQTPRPFSIGLLIVPEPTSTSIALCALVALFSISHTRSVRNAWR